MTSDNEIPQIIKDVGFDFHWDEEKVWKLNVPTNEMDISELTWHFDIPFLWEGGVYNLKPQEVIDNPDAHQEEYERTMRADLTHPIDIMENKGRWLILDGLHRLIKASIQGMKKIRVRKVSRERIPEIEKDSSEIGLKRGTVILKRHRDSWGKDFEREKESLQELLGDIVADIQHIGSTAIPNLSAKPIIDILVGIRSWFDITKVRKLLENAGYEYRENGSTDEKVLFAKGAKEKRTHYIHITEVGSSVWQNDLSFRDYLLAYPKEVSRYEKLKQELAAKHAENRELYTKGKSDYIKSVLTKAHREQPERKAK